MKIKTREDLGKLFQHYNKLGSGAEIGVKEGWNAKNILQDFKGLLFLVDIWQDEKDLAECLKNTVELQCDFHRGYSVEVAKSFKNESLDFVYIDADHKYESVKADFKAWFPKVRSGGIISGHDYSLKFKGVVRFVNELSKIYDVNFTNGDIYEGINYESWYFVKP